MMMTSENILVRKSQVFGSYEWKLLLPLLLGSKPINPCWSLAAAAQSPSQDLDFWVCIPFHLALAWIKSYAPLWTAWMWLRTWVSIFPRDSVGRLSLWLMFSSTHSSPKLWLLSKAVSVLYLLPTARMNKCMSRVKKILDWSLNCSKHNSTSLYIESIKQEFSLYQNLHSLDGRKEYKFINGMKSHQLPDCVCTQYVFGIVWW